MKGGEEKGGEEKGAGGLPPATGNGKPPKPPRTLDSWESTPEPWPDPVDGAELLKSLESLFTRHLVLPEHAACAMALWTVHTYAYHLGDVAAYLALMSPQKRCGKTTALSIMAELAHRALPASNVTPASLFRVIERGNPTLMIDEVDSFLRDNNELRGILNSGFMRRAAFVLRTVGETHETKQFPVYGPKLLAGIGRLSDTLADRSVIISMRRKNRDDAAERFRGINGEEHRRKCVRWVKDHEAQLTNPDPDIPRALNDRAADLWRPLIAIADLVDKEWAAKARKAAAWLSGDGDDDSESTKLLASIRAYFAQLNADPMTPGGRTMTRELLAFLNAQEEEPWPSMNRGDGMNARQLADKLKPYGINSRTLRDGPDRAKGYTEGDFADAFARYLPLPPYLP